MFHEFYDYHLDTTGYHSNGKKLTKTPLTFASCANNSKNELLNNDQLFKIPIFAKFKKIQLAKNKVAVIPLQYRYTCTCISF